MKKSLFIFSGILIFAAISFLLFSQVSKHNLAVLQSAPDESQLALEGEEDEEGEPEIDLSEDIVSQIDDSVPIATPSGDNPIVIENRKAGNSSWGFAGTTQSDDTNNQIKGYASKASVRQGNEIEIKVTVNPAQSFTMDIYRMGWYQGLGGRLMKSVGPLNGIKQASCPRDSYGMTECRWRTSYTLAIPDDWLSGAYIVKLKNNRGYSNMVNFTVKDDRQADFLFQNSVITWQAYNYWGGKSLYNGSPTAVKVSFDRPYSTNGTRLFSWESSMIRFMEKNGYDVSYSTDVDTHVSGAKLLDYKAFLSVGHDEYWTWEMRDHVENARNQGVNLGFFGGNDSYWQVRFEDSSSGEPNRVVVGYKFKYEQDPYFHSSDSNKKRRTTGQWRFNVVNRAEQQMMGTMYAFNLNDDAKNLDLTVKEASHFAFAGTGLSDGDTIPNIYGSEYDRINYSYSRPAGLIELARGTKSGYQTASSTIYTAPSGAIVFSAGSMNWVWRLDNLSHHVANAKIQRITANVLDKFASN